MRPEDGNRRDDSRDRDDEEKLVDPIAEMPGFDDTESRISILGHPIHAMSVAFPIALTFCLFGADLLYWWTGDAFWARVALWAAGAGFGLGMVAALSGTAELLFVSGIRARAAPWTHAILAVTLIGLLGANWGHRLAGYVTAVLPWGLLMSALCLVMVGVTGWHGGKLVFDYRLGTSKGN